MAARPSKAMTFVAVAAAAALALSACSSSGGGASPGAGGGGEGTASGGGSGVKLIAAGKLTVCTHLPYAPFQSNDDQGKTVGFDVDMMDLVAKKVGAKQAVVDTPFEGIKTGQNLSMGKCDIAAAGMTINDERKKAILFSLPYFDATQAMLVKKDSTVASLADLKGKKLGAQAATTGLDYANAHKAEGGYEVVEFQDLATETQALTTGQVDGAINDLPVWSEAIKQDKGATKVATQFDTGEQYGFGMKLGNDALKKVVDDVITSSQADGSYAALYKKWIGTEPPKK